MEDLSDLTPRERAIARDKVVRAALAAGQESSPLLTRQERARVGEAWLLETIFRAINGEKQIVSQDPWNARRRHVLDLT